MNLWRQTKRFVCPRCKAPYLHDKAHKHHCYECPKRATRKGGVWAQPQKN